MPEEILRQIFNSINNIASHILSSNVKRFRLHFRRIKMPFRINIPISQVIRMDYSKATRPQFRPIWSNTIYKRLQAMIKCRHAQCCHLRTWGHICLIAIHTLSLLEDDTCQLHSILNKTTNSLMTQNTTKGMHNQYNNCSFNQVARFQKHKIYTTCNQYKIIPEIAYNSRQIHHKYLRFHLSYHHLHKISSQSNSKLPSR